MLKEITIKNFKSYKKEVTFSMEADLDKVSEYEDHIVEINDNKLLKIASFYGPNGGGKSNLLDALLFIKAVITNDVDALAPREVVNVFSNDDTIEFTVFFVDEIYEYGINIEVITQMVEEYSDNMFRQRYKLKPEIINETMVYRKRGKKDFITCYERNETGKVVGKIFEFVNFSMPNLSKSRTVLGKLFSDYADNDNNIESFEVIKKLYSEFESIVRFDSIDRSFINQYFNLSKLKFIEKEKEKIIEYLNSVDIKISDIKVYRSGRPELIYFERTIEVDGVKMKRNVPLSEESKGTIKIFNTILKLMYGIKSNKIFLFDDMNAYLHPKLCASIIQQFTSQQGTHSQLIFNSHDLINMNNSLFRRDEIWFAYRDEEYSSKIVPLSNIVNYKGEAVRKDAKYSKQYLEGKYGSDPFVMKGICWYE